MHVLVVDDEPNIAELVALGLAYEGFDVETVTDGRRALRAAAESTPDLVVLDIGLPDIDGFEVCRRIRAAGFQAPVLFLTARGAVEDRVRGLTIGGDDYLAKPFSLDELVARVKAIARRTGTGRATSRLQCGDLVLDEDAREVHRGAHKIVLTPTEYQLLRYLMLNQGIALSRGQILAHVWEYDFRGDSNVVETYISYLRRKLDIDGEPLIETVRGFGYRLKAPRPGKPSAAQRRAATPGSPGERA